VLGVLHIIINYIDNELGIKANLSFQKEKKSGFINEM